VKKHDNEPHANSCYNENREGTAVLRWYLKGMLDLILVVVLTLLVFSVLDILFQQVVPRPEGSFYQTFYPAYTTQPNASDTSATASSYDKDMELTKKGDSEYTEPISSKPEAGFLSTYVVSMVLGILFIVGIGFVAMLVYLHQRHK
jgi:hypothetical protein